MRKELVIAAYDKDLSWVKSLNDDVKITIYRKGINNNDDNEIFLEVNKGRCVHSFFNHILTNYDNLSDYTFFVQDYPFDHWEKRIRFDVHQYDTFDEGMVQISSTWKFSN